MPSGHGTREVNWPAVTGYIFAGASGAGFSFTVLYLAAWGSPSRARRGQWRQVTKLQARRALAVAGPSVTRALHRSQGEVSASCLHTSRDTSAHLRYGCIRGYNWPLQCVSTPSTPVRIFLLQYRVILFLDNRDGVSWSGDGGRSGRAGRPRYFSKGIQRCLFRKAS
jgi:hypothetical protein